MLEMTTARSAIKILRRFIIFAPYHHFAFLIQAKLSFTIKWQHAPRANPIPHLILVTLTRPVYIATVISFSCFPSFVRSRMVYFPFPSEPAKPSLRKTT